ncbi:hypothetical protein DYB38_013533, partial [Aphanomyces astaci]
VEVIKSLQCLLTFGKLPRGSIEATATLLGINRKTVSSICKGFINQGSSPSKKAGRFGPKLHYTQWFNADKDHRKFYLTKGEALKGRACKSTRFLPKVMFLAAVMRHRYDAGDNLVFDGKIGMWPFITKTTDSRSSRNRSAGTLVTTLVNVNAAVYQDFLLNRVSVEKFDNVFLIFQAVIRLVLEHNGDNQFRLPHMNKAAMRRAEEKHSMRMTAVLDESKLTILFIMKGAIGGRIEASEFPIFPGGHSYVVQEKAWMGDRVRKSYLRTVLHDDIEEASVILVAHLYDIHESGFVSLSHIGITRWDQELGRFVVPTDEVDDTATPVDDST